MSNKTFQGPRATSHEALTRPLAAAIAQVQAAADRLAESITTLNGTVARIVEAYPIDDTPARGTSADYPILLDLVNHKWEDYEGQAAEDLYYAEIKETSLKAGQEVKLCRGDSKGGYAQLETTYTLTADDVAWIVANIDGVTDAGADPNSDPDPKE